MTSLTRRFTIRTQSWTPTLQPGAWKLLRQADAYSQRGIKFRDTAIFHSRAEFLFAGLLEIDTSVTRYCPQPFTFRIGSNGTYVPDFFVKRGADKVLYELKPRGEFEKPWLTDFMVAVRHHGFEFLVVANEECYAQEVRAENSWRIVRLLNVAQDIDTEATEYEVLDTLNSGPVRFGELVPRRQGQRDTQTEVACFRLLMKKRVFMDLDQPLGDTTQVRSLS